MKRIVAFLGIAISMLAGCAGNTPRTDSSNPDLTGGWTFQVQTGRNVVHGAMTLVADRDGYRGTLTTDQGDNVLTVRSLTLHGSAIDMRVESPNGDVNFSGVLNADGRTFQGTVTYHTGQAFPMSGRRR